MNRELLVEGDPHQTRLAVLEAGRLVEFFVERRRGRGLVGNIYKGRVRRVLPGMRAAFVDLGLERDGYLYLEEMACDEAGEPGGEGRRSGDGIPRRGEQVVVQIVREGLADKGPRVTTEITIPGRYLVLTPQAGRVGISRRIEDPDERTRLKTIALELWADALEETGCIVRTAAVGAQAEDLAREYQVLADAWREIEGRTAASAVPAQVHQEEELAVRVIRDHFGEDFAALLVDGVDAHRVIREYLGRVQPELLTRLERSRRGLFDRYRIDDGVDAALEPKAPLPSGGHLVINQTEALVAIDVNSGRDVGAVGGGGNFRDTVLRTNLEAVAEAVRQIRLRDLSGILVIDLIDMEREEDRRTVFARLEEELLKDRARKRVLEISEFGLVQLTRQRRRENLERALTGPCPTCRGRGRIKSVATICLELRRACLAHAGRGCRQVAVRVHPAVLDGLNGSESDVLDGMQGAFDVPILLEADPDLHREHFVVTELERS
ncbi:MAG: Rne/Rng family ribonuclease [Acidobacteriota bacterium]|nr:Rne/Rng family ribonuclease [Acidobacteriota bacterium]MDE3265745.1 Rne/Rng family ribonuclease [Acidobacteriota bacterium]